MSKSVRLAVSNVIADGAQAACVGTKAIKSLFQSAGNWLDEYNEVNDRNRPARVQAKQDEDLMETYSELDETAKEYASEYGIDTEGKSNVDISNEVRSKLEQRLMADRERFKRMKISMGILPASTPTINLTSVTKPTEPEASN